MSKKDAVSASSMGTRVITAAGCHVLRIKGYSQTKLLGTGAAALSCRFEAAGQIWRISYYPNGQVLSPGSICLALHLISSEHNWSAGHVNAVARFTLLPHHGKQPPPAESAQPHSVRISGKFNAGSEWCFRFIKREELERSEGYLVDDCFAVRCDIDVVNTWARRDRAQDVVETTEEEAGLMVWRSDGEDGGSTSAAAWQAPWQAARPFAGWGLLLVFMILFKVVYLH
jgi:hypothetical protein